MRGNTLCGRIGAEGDNVAASKVFEGLQAQDRLSELRLPEEVLTTAMCSGLAAIKDCTEHDPPFLKGLLLYCKLIRSLRDQLVSDGWLIEGSRNLSLTVRGDHALKIMVARGDKHAGSAVPGVTPSTKRERGKAVYEELRGQGIDTADMIAGLRDYADPGNEPGGVQVWVLLYHPECNKLKAELSLPYRMAKKDSQIRTWRQRILLPQQVAGATETADGR